MDIDEIIGSLNDQIQMLEDLKTSIIELQEETNGLISAVNMWFELHGHELPEVGNE